MVRGEEIERGARELEGGEGGGGGSNLFTMCERSLDQGNRPSMHPREEGKSGTQFPDWSRQRQRAVYRICC